MTDVSNQLISALPLDVAALLIASFPLPLGHCRQNIVATINSVVSPISSAMFTFLLEGSKNGQVIKKTVAMQPMMVQLSKGKA